MLTRLLRLPARLRFPAVLTLLVAVALAGVAPATGNSAQEGSDAAAPAADAEGLAGEEHADHGAEQELSLDGVVAAASRNYERAVDITFPLAGPNTYGRYDYHQDRDGGRRKHQSTDLMAAKMVRIHAAMGGTVQYMTGVTEPMPSWGYGIAILGDDGLRYVYLHINNDTPGTDDGRGGLTNAYAPGVTPGGRVERGQFLAYVGDSGAAETTPPHLHFQIHDPNLNDARIQQGAYLDPTRLDPWASLQAAQARGDVPGAYRRPPTRVGRLGDGEVGTAVALSKLRTEPAATVIIVPQGSAYHAPLAAPLAGASQGVVLVSGPDGLDPDVAAEVARLRPRKAYLLGGRKRLPPRVAVDLRAAGVRQVERLTASTRFQLSARIAAEVAGYDLPMVRAYLVQARRGDGRANWQDAVSIGPLAARRRGPILLTRSDRLPAATADALRALQPDGVVAIGSAIDESVLVAAAGAAGAPGYRVPGQTLYETSVNLANAAIVAGMTSPVLHIASGAVRPEALTAGPVVAERNAALILVDGRRPGRAAEAEAWIAASRGRFSSAAVLGGETSFSVAGKRHLRRLLNP